MNCVLGVLFFFTYPSNDCSPPPYKVPSQQCTVNGRSFGEIQSTFYFTEKIDRSYNLPIKTPMAFKERIFKFYFFIVTGYEHTTDCECHPDTCTIKIVSYPTFLTGIKWNNVPKFRWIECENWNEWYLKSYVWRNGIIWWHYYLKR